MKKYIIFFLLIASSGFCAKGAFSPIKPYPNNYNQGILFEIFTTYIKKHDKMFLTWANGSDPKTSIPWYAVYDCKTNSFSVNPSASENTYFDGVDDLVSSCYNPKNDYIFYAWKSKSPYGDDHLWYRLYDCKNNTFITPYANQIEGSVFASKSPTCSYNANNNTIFLTWPGHYQEPSFAVFDCSTMQFTTPPSKLFSGTQQADSYVNHIYSPKANKSFIIWSELNTLKPLYTVFDASGNLQSLSPMEIPNPSNLGTNAYYGCLISKHDRVFFFSETAELQTIYGVYDFDSKTFTSQLQRLDSIEGFLPPATYLQHNDSIFIALSPNSLPRHPAYAIFECSTNTLSTAPTIIDPNYTEGAFYSSPCYNPKHNNVFITWSTSSKETGEYCTFHELKERAKQLMVPSNVIFEKGMR